MSIPIQKFIDEYDELYKTLISQNQISMAINISEHYRKVLLLSCASYYESQITDTIQEFVKSNSGDARIYCFLNNKAIKRQYHTFFNWDDNNISQFLGLFGSDFKDKIKSEIKKDPELTQNIKDFLAVGNERNKMVHENFLEYKLDKTFEEIVNLHKSAIKFIEYIKEIF